jgi:pyruvate-formate lyase-activating enzyme
MTNNEDTVCHLRWGYPNFSLSRNEIRTCCKTPFQTINDGMMDKYGTEIFLNTDYQKKRRMEMLQGVKHSDCKSCWSLEEVGAKSLRGNNPYGFVDYANRYQMFQEFTPPTLVEIANQVTIDSKILESNNPFMLEVSLGNTCDMKCMYCNHVYSSQWAAESLKNNTINVEIYKQVQSNPNERFINLFWEWVNTKAKHSLDRIGIIGGEPLITPEFYDFLDKLIEVYTDKEGPKTRIWVVTNLNATNNYYNKFLEYIPKLSEKFILEVHISMEALNDQAEYIRNGLDWNRFESNVNKLFASDADIELAFLPSVTALAIPRFPEFLKWVYDLSKTHNKAVMLKQNIVTHPDVQSPFILPPEFADYLDPAIDWMQSISVDMPDVSDKFGTWPGYTDFLIKLRDGIRYNKNDNTMTRPRFATWFNDFDNKRHLNFVNTFPELANFYNECKTQ